MDFNQIKGAFHNKQNGSIEVISDTSHKIEPGTVSIDNAIAWLNEVKETASPAMMQVVGAQMQMLETVQSPTLTGMMVDNLITCLDKALKSSTSEIEKSNVRDIYSQIIQNYVFVSEAKLEYALDKNKEEAINLLERAGTYLSKTLENIASLAVPAGKVAGMAGQATNAMRNFSSLQIVKALSDANEKNGILANLSSLIGNKKILEEKKTEFFVFLENIFETLDKYHPLFGSSIIINGLLTKYKKPLTKWYAEKKMKPIKCRISSADLNKISELTDELSNSIGNISKKGIISTLSGFVSSASKLAIDGILKGKAAKYDLTSFCDTCDYYSANIAEISKNLEQEELRLQQLKDSHKEIGILKLSQRKESQTKIDEQLEMVNQKKKELKTIQTKLQQLENLFPERAAIKADVDKYEANLSRIESKYAIAILR